MAQVLLLHDSPTVLSRLERTLQQRLVVPIDLHLERVRGWHDLSRALLRSPDGVVVFDPYFGGCLDHEAVERFLSRFASLYPFIACLTWTSEAARDVLQLGKWGVLDVVALGSNDYQGELAKVVLFAWRQSTVRRWIDPMLTNLPTEVQRALRIAIPAPQRLTVKTLAKRMACSARSLQRMFLRAGIPAPSTVIARCRLIHAARLLAAGGTTFERVASALGYTDAASLRRAFHRHFGTSSAEVRAEGAPARLATQLLRPTTDSMVESVAFGLKSVAFEPADYGPTPPSSELIAAAG